MNDTVLRLEGVIDVETVATLWPTLRARAAADSRIEVIDLAGVTALDSSGFAMIRCLQKTATREGRTPRLAAAPVRFAQIGLAHRVEADGH